jgi:hypothetical protein
MKRSLALLTCLALLIASPASLAQNTASRQAAEADGSVVNTFDVVFPGGTVAQFADAVRQATNHRVNIVVNPDAADITVPALALSGVDARATMQLLEGRGTMRSSITINEVAPSRPDSLPVFVIDSYDRTTVQRRGAVTVATDGSSVWSLTPVIDSGKKLEDILSAIETALAMFPQGMPKAQVRLHRETNLLIAHGDGEQLKAISAVLKALNPALHVDEPRDSVPAASSRPPTSGGQGDKAASAASIDALRGELAGLRAQIQQLQTEVQALGGRR